MKPEPPHLERISFRWNRAASLFSLSIVMPRECGASSKLSKALWLLDRPLSRAMTDERSAAYSIRSESALIAYIPPGARQVKASCDGKRDGRLHSSDRRRLSLADDRHILAVAIRRMLPAVLVVIGHASLDQRFHLLEPSGELRLLQLEHPDELVAAGIVHLVELVAGAELGADGVPQKLHDLDALLVVDTVRAAHIFGEIFVDLRVFKVARMRGQIDEAGSDHLL